MASIFKYTTYSSLLLFMFLIAPCFGQLVHPFDGNGEGQMLVEEDGRVFIYLNLQTNDSRKKRVLALTPNEPMDTLTAIPDTEGSFIIKSVSNELNVVQGFTVKWTSISDHEETENYYFSLRDTPSDPNGDLGTIVNVYMVQGTTYNDEDLTKILDEYDEYDTEYLDDIWIEALIETGEHGLESATNWKCKNCDSGGPGSIACTLEGGFGVVCGAGYYACCKDNGWLKDTAVCCPDGGGTEE